MKRTLFVLLTFFALTSVRAETLSINQFSGLNTDDSPLTLSAGQSPDSENVLTDDGPGLQGRRGFISFSTQTPIAMWEFPKSDGTRYLIANVGTQLLADIGAGSFSTVVSTVPSDRTVAGSVLGDKFYFADTLNGLKYWDSSTVVVASATMKVDKLVTWKGRLVAAGIVASQRVIFLSKYLDGTNWTAPTNPSDDDAAQIPVAGAIDENIQALFASFQDLLIWFKKNSFGGIYGSRRSNFSQRTFSDYIGVANPETIRDCDGLLRWLGNNRVVWEFDGSTYKKISEQIDVLLGTISQGDSSAKSNTQTTEAQFEAGSQSPAGFLDTTSVPGSLTPRTTTFLDTAVGDFSAGTDSPVGYTTSTTAYTSLQLSTTAPVASFADTADSDFNSGTFTSVSSTQTSGSVELILSAQSTQQQLYPGDSGTGTNVCTSDNINYAVRSFTASSNFLMTNLILRLRHGASTSNGGLISVSLKADSSGSPGATLASGGPLLAIDNTVHDVTVGLSGTVNIDSGSRYWIILGVSGGGYSCDFAGGVRDNIWWYNGASSDASEKQCVFNGCTPATPSNFKYQALGKTYGTPGNIVSRSFDVGFTTNSWLWTWSSLTANSSLPTNTALTYETQTSSDSSSWNTLASVTSGNPPTSSVQRYIRYKASLSTTKAYSTPQLNDVTIAMSDRMRPAAVFTSRKFDTGIATPAWGYFLSSPTAIGGGAAYSFTTQSSSDGTTWDAAVAASSGTVVGSNRKRYIRYIYSSTATSPAIYNRVDDVTITGKSTGTFTTQAVTVGSQITSWGPVGAAITNNGGSFTIQFATSTDGVTFSSWSTISNNSVPTVSTAPFAATRFLFTLAIATQTPQLDDVTINWNEGSNIKAASAYINQRYWLGVAIGATTNNRVLVFDKLRQWQRYNGISLAATSLYNSKLYFGNTSGIFQAENGYSDNGVAIAAYYTTPTIVPNKLDLYSNFDYLYMTTDSSDATFTGTFQINGIATNYALASLQMNSTTGFQNFKLPFSASEVQTGKDISFKWAVSGTSFWHISNGALYHQPLALPE